MPAQGYVASSAESPAVAANGEVERLAGLAERGELGTELLKSRWHPQAPNTVPTIDPQPINLAPKLSAYRGKNVAILFWTPDKNTSGEITNMGPLQIVQKLAEAAKQNKWKLEVVVVTNLPATKNKSAGEDKPTITAEEFFAAKGLSLPFVADPKGEIKLAMGIYSTPLLLIDAKGNLIWKLRMGQPNDNALEAGDLMDAASALGIDKYRIGPAKTLGAMGDEGTPIFDFENGTEGWTLTGNAWGPEGTCSEKYYPGLVKGFIGHRWLSSFTGDAMRGTGAAVSPEFTVTKRYLHLLVGGGDLSTRQGVALVCGGATIKTVTGENTYELNPVTWDLTPWMGRKLRLVVYDTGNSEQRDGIMLDAVTASDYPGLPKGFADRHDPNNAAHVARVAADLPPEWIALQNGEFHMSAKPGKTYEATCIAVVDFWKGSGPIKIVRKKLPSTPAQTVSSYWGELLIDGRSTKSTDIGGDWIKIEARRPISKNAKVQLVLHTTITPNNLTTEKGPSPEQLKLDPYFKAKISKAPPWDSEKYTAELLAVFKREGLLRFPGETETAHLLRAWRWIQRTWTDAAPWGGWPTADPTTGKGIYTQRSMSCPAAGVFCDTAWASGRPATGGQGFWANNAGATCTPHVRALIPLEKAGWVLLDDEKTVTSPFGQFTPGRQSGDNYFQEDYWPESKKHEDPEEYTNVDLLFDGPESIWKTRSADTPELSHLPKQENGG